jgi:putative oxidoreductase
MVITALAKLLKTQPVPAIYARIITGLVFVSEGIQKFIHPDQVGLGRFQKIGFSNAAFWANFTGSFEIVCGGLLLLGLLTRLAAIPLFIIMMVAFVTTKYPILIDKGFWVMAHEYRTDFAMTVLLLFLLRYGGGKYSIDLTIYKASNTRIS